MPILAFVLAGLSIGMLAWIDRINERQRRNFDLADAIMDIQIKTATSHLWLHEAISGNHTADIQKVKDEIDFAMSLAEAVLNGGKSEHGLPLQPLEDSKLRKRVEEIKSSLTKFKTIVLERIEVLELAGRSSGLDHDLDVVFKELNTKANALEITVERDQIRAQARWSRLYNGVHLAWAGILFISIICIWNHEVKRRTAEKEQQKANEQLQSQTEELKKYQEHLKELVEERTSDLTTTIRFYKSEITERKQTEESLRASENKFRTLIENLPQKICLKDKNSVYLYCNENFARDLNARPDEMIGKTDYNFYPKELAEKHIAEDKRIIKLGKTEETEERYVNDGREVVVQKIKLPIKNERGEIGGILGIFWDITEIIRLESIAEAANMMENIGYVISGIRHELGNPINSIKMTLGVLANKIDTAPKETVKKYIDWTTEELARVEYLLKTLKNFNMYENPELQNVSMKPFLDNFLSLVTSDLEKKGIRIGSLVHPGAEWGFVDPRALQQVMLNIINNASDAVVGKEDPQIVIDILKANDRIKIVVNDNGNGMSEEQLKELFKPFRTTKIGGTGLGLVIAKKMLTGMNGAIEIKSKKGAGTTVDIFIPKGEEEMKVMS
jgi:PAS domain S-box-containing protein